MFFRKGTETGQRAPARSAGTEAQLRELRVKARRRLIGALALVLAAFIVVPWLFDEPVPDDAHAPIVVPAPVAGLPPATEPAPSPDTASPDSAPTDAERNPGPLAAASGDGDVEPADPSQSSEPPRLAPPAVTAAPEPPARTQPEPSSEKPAAEPAKPKPADRAAVEKPAAKPADRTDDGSVALALLSGKAPPAAEPAKPKPAAAGRYYLQVAAYTTEQDANARRDSLRQAGVSDAYVERGQSNGRTVYRLRVGPFGSHEAAQAAQARLRALGYQNGLISGK
ncbi:SPOR domain-containing protein [Castellaniella hirudinis]|uniref:SPOR domain-containing protein n=1 Tax=Castellaniella hirudinis TaxID=1144617 RepID=A0ABV8RYM4_9BURK